MQDDYHRKRIFGDLCSQHSILECAASFEYLFLRALTIFLLGKRKADEFLNRGKININYFMCRHHLLRGIGFFRIINKQEGFGVGKGMRCIVPLDALGVPGEVKRAYMKPKKGDLVIDVGAHYGFYTLYASQLVGDKGTILAFEPHPHNYERLLTNMEVNKIKNAKAFSTALGDFDGQTKLYITPHSDGHSTFFRTENYLNVKTRKMDTVVAKLGLEKVDLIKIDAEGDEMTVLKGAIETIKKYKPKITMGVYHFQNEIIEIKKWFKTNATLYDIKTVNNRYLHATSSKFFLD